MQNPFQQIRIAAVRDLNKKVTPEDLATIREPERFQRPRSLRYDMRLIEQDAANTWVGRQYLGEKDAVAAANIDNSAEAPKVAHADGDLGKPFRAGGHGTIEDARFLRMFRPIFPYIAAVTWSNAVAPLRTA